MVNNTTLSHKEAAAYLGIEESTLYGWVSQRKITVVKVGRLNKYRLADLDAYLEAHTVKAA
jgi:excisionase family DNA binding protein